MRKIVLTFLAVLLATAVFCQPWDGPFGLKMGLTYNQLKAYDPNITKMEENIYLMSKVPTPHPDFKYYRAILSSETGLCKIVGDTKDIYCTPNGKQLQQKFWEYAFMLKELYDDYLDIEFDYLEEGSIWYQTQDFMMGLLVEERNLAYIWHQELETEMKKNISDITLVASAKDMNTGCIRLTYEFSNYEQFYQDEENIKRSAF